MKKKWLGIIITLLLATTYIFFASCAKKAPQEIKIGAIFSETGSIAPYGERSVEGLTIAMDEINEKGGIHGKNLKIIVEDTKSSGKDAISALQKLISVDKVRIAIGPCASSLALECAPLANRNKVVLLATTIAADKYSTPDDYTFRNWPSAKIIAKKIAEIAYDKLGIRNVAIMYLNNDMGKSYELGFREAFSSLGGKILISEAYSSDTYDYRSQLIKIKSTNADALFLTGHTESGYILKQMKELGIDVKILSEIGIEDPKVKEIADDLINGIVYATAAYNPQSTSPLVRNYEQRYMEKYGKHSEVFAACAYDAVMIAAKAIENVGDNSDSIREYLCQLRDFPGVTGNISFDRNGDVIKEIAIKKVIDGQYFFLDENLNPLR
jgi:branched-chain amino acid transport system substrate-binding protein